MSSKTILIADDEPAIRDMVKLALDLAGYETTEAGDIREAQQSIANKLPDLVLLDWMLPGGNGIDLARRLKREELTQELPIIMLTAKADEDNKVRGLEVGADDYITKPFSPRELVARVKAVLRRSAPGGEDGILEVNGLRLDSVSHRVTANSEPLDMGPTEYRLLHFFMSHPERVYSRSQLLDGVWGGNVYVEERTVDVHIRRLRKALAISDFDKYVQTVRGAGYRFSSKL